MRSALIGMLLFVAAAAHAQTATTPAPDYSADHLRQIFTTIPTPPDAQHNVHVGFGYVDFRALGMQWRLGFLPILAPLHGSVPGTTRVIPDAFSLNHVMFPGAPPPVERTADVKRELRRIARITARTE